MSYAVRVTTPVRLHFGLLSFGQPEGPQFGGVGMMVSPPGIELQISPAERFTVHGPMAERAEECVRRLAGRWGFKELPACVMHIEHVPPHHTGLGVGTQFNLAVAAGMGRFLQRDELRAGDEILARNLAQAAGRGQRSAVGTYGFLRGGLIVDRGKTENEPLGTLAGRYAVPEPWRIVLIRAEAVAGLADERERQAFAGLPPVPSATTEKLWSIVERKMLPTLAAGDCAMFGEAVYEYGRTAGECFSAIQGGPFVSPMVEQLVGTIRDFGITGVGQSSWGPTVLAIVENPQAAEQLVERLRSDHAGHIAEITVATPNNTGAEVSQR